MSDLIERLEKGIAYSERFDHRLDNVEVADLCGRMKEARDELTRLQSLSDQIAPASGWHGQGPMSTTDGCRASGMNKNTSNVEKQA